MSDQSHIGIWEALDEAESVRLRALLMRALSGVVNEWGVTQKEAAERLQVTQPRLNYLLTGKVDKFSLDALVNMLAGANLQLEVAVRARDAA